MLGHWLEMLRESGGKEWGMADGGEGGGMTQRWEGGNDSDMGGERHCDSMSAERSPVAARRRGATGLEFWRRAVPEEVHCSQYQCLVEQVRQG